MKIETVIGVVFLAIYLALSVSPSHGQTAGKILKVYEPLKKVERSKIWGTLLSTWNIVSEEAE